VIKCYSSWLTLGVVPLCNVQNSGIMHLALSILAQHTVPTSLHDAAADCVTSLLARLEREVPDSSHHSLNLYLEETSLLYVLLFFYFVSSKLLYYVISIEQFHRDYITDRLVAKCFGLVIEGIPSICLACVVNDIFIIFI
jgi:hypothetical protein